jgi:hypothetical protein
MGAVVAVLAVVGCSGDPDADRPGTGTTGTGGGDGPLYAAASGLCGTESCQTYLLTVSSTEKQEIDVLQNGIEFQGLIYPFAHKDSVFVYSSEAPRITRYTATADGGLQEGPALDFSALGSRRGRSIVLSDDKAYTFDVDLSTIFVWDPAEMILTGTRIDISLIQREGFTPYVFTDRDAARERDDLLFVPVDWYSNDTQLNSTPGMLVIDTARDEVVKLITDTRCVGLESSAMTPSGDMYFFPAAAILNVNAADPSIPACALRIRAGEDEFDPDFLLNISEATGGRIGCCGTQGPGGTAYVQVLYEERVDVTDRSELWDKAANDWRLWNIDLETGAGREVSSIDWFSSSGPNGYELPEGQVFASIGKQPTDPTFRRDTTLFDLTSAAEPVPTFTFNGFVTMFARLR